MRALLRQNRKMTGPSPHPGLAEQQGGSATLTWSSSPERRLYVDELMRRSARRGWLSLAVVIGAAVALAYQDEAPIFGALGVVGVVAAGALLVWAVTPYFFARRAYLERNQAEKAKAVADALNDLIGSGPADVLPLTALYVFNRRQLDEYQTLTKRQAAVAFRNAQLAAALGFGLLVAGVVLVLALGAQGAPSARYTIGALSGLGTLMSGYLSRTFFRSYQDAMRQLAIYYEEPFLTSRALSAERVIEKMPQLRSPGSDASLAVLVQRLLEPGGSSDSWPHAAAEVADSSGSRWSRFRRSRRAKRSKSSYPDESQHSG